MSDLEIFSLLIIHSSPSQVCIGFLYFWCCKGHMQVRKMHLSPAIFSTYWEFSSATGYSVQVETRVNKAP